MTIQEIKQSLTLAEVIKHYGHKADKYNRICCPFHDDKNPSMQLYWKTHTAFCFSSNCKLKGKSIDVIDFILHKDNCTKHQAIKKAQAMITGETPAAGIPRPSKEQFLQKMFTYFKNGVHSSNPAKEYIALRNLDFKKLEIGYNAAQFHHGTRKDETLPAGARMLFELARVSFNACNWIGVCNAFLHSNTFVSLPCVRQI